MKAQVGPSAKDITSDKILQAFLGEPDVAVVGYFKTASKLKEAFLKVADKLREKIRFGISDSLQIEEGNDEYVN